MKPKVGRASLLLLVLGQSALAEGGDGWNRAYATTGQTRSRQLSSGPAALIIQLAIRQREAHTAIDRALHYKAAGFNLSFI